MLIHTRRAFRPRSVCECLFTLLWGVLWICSPMSCWLFLHKSCFFLPKCSSVGAVISNRTCLSLFHRKPRSLFLFFFWHMSCKPFLNADSDRLAALQEINEDYWFLSSTHHWLVITCYHSSTCLQNCQILFLYVCQNKWRAWCW